MSFFLVAVKVKLNVPSPQLWRNAFVVPGDSHQQSFLKPVEELKIMWKFHFGEKTFPWKSFFWSEFAVMKRSLESLMSWGPNKEKFLSFLASAWTFFPDKKKVLQEKSFRKSVKYEISKHPFENVKWVHKMDKYFVLLALLFI